MSGPTKKHIDFGERAERLEKWAVAFGVVVVAGLPVECGPDIVGSILHHHWPKNDVIGTAIVTIGVAGEVVLSGIALLATIKADREHRQEIAALNAETERLRRENNETALILMYRSLGNIQQFEHAMRVFSGTRYELDVQGDDAEAYNFLGLLHASLVRAGWVNLRNIRRRLDLGWGVAVTTIGTRDSVPARDALADWLDTHGVGVLTMATEAVDVDPGRLHIAIGPRPVAIDQQHLLRESYALRRSRPVTPPQA